MELVKIFPIWSWRRPFLRTLPEQLGRWLFEPKRLELAAVVVAAVEVVAAALVLGGRSSVGLRRS